MEYKQIGENLSFADLAVSKTLEHNRSLKMMEKINGSINWENVEDYCWRITKLENVRKVPMPFLPYC